MFGGGNDYCFTRTVGLLCMSCIFSAVVFLRDITVHLLTVSWNFFIQPTFASLRIFQCSVFCVLIGCSLCQSISPVLGFPHLHKSQVRAEPFHYLILYHFYLKVWTLSWNKRKKCKNVHVCLRKVRSDFEQTWNIYNPSLQIIFGTRADFI